MAKLGEVCTFFAGTGFPNQYQGNANGEYPFFKVGDISKNIQMGQRTLEYCDNYISNETVKIIRGTIIPQGTVVFAKIGEALRLNRRAITTCKCLIDNNVMGLKPIDGVLTTEYFYYLMTALDLQKYCEATTVPSVRKSTLEKIEIVVPSIEEQKRTVGILNKLTDLISLRKQQLAKLDEIVKARFVEMFGDLKRNSMNWPIYSFNDFARIDTIMIRDFTKYGNYPHIGIDSIEKDSGKLSGYRTVKDDSVISGKYLFTPKHIIYSKIRPNLNKVALPDFTGVCSADAYPILPKAGICNRVFLAYTLRSPVFLDYILTFSNRTNLPKVNKQQVEGFCCPIPNIKYQERFASFFDEITRQKLTIEQSLDKLEVLKKSLMQEYFK